MASMQTARDISVVVRSPGTTSERRINPSWTVSQLKSKLEYITGIPPSCQVLEVKIANADSIQISHEKEDSTLLEEYQIQPLAELQVTDTRPAGSVTLDFSDPSSVQRYTMSSEAYESLPNSVLAWKKANKLGRFDPHAPEVERQKVESLWHDIVSRGIELSRRCQIGAETGRRGTISFVGEVPEISSGGGPWVGVVLDEPSGKTDGSVKGKSYFQCPPNCGIFVRPDRVTAGDFPPLDETFNEDLEEI